MLAANVGGLVLLTVSSWQRLEKWGPQNGAINKK